MKILFLIHKPQARGQEIFSAQLGNQFLQQGHEVVLLSLYGGDFDLNFQGKHIHFNCSSNIDTILPWQWSRLAKVIRNLQPDLIQANGGDTVKFLTLTKFFFPFPGKLLFNNGGVLSHYLSSNWKRWIYTKLLAPWDAAISVSRHAQSDLAQFLPDTCRQTHIPIGIPDRELPVGPALDFQVFVHIAGFTPEKNHVELITLFSEYLKQDPTAQLWLIGEGPLRMEAESLADQIAFNSIRFFGALSNPWSLVPQNALLVLPSKIEGMPAVLVESFLAKIPVIAYGVGGIPEMTSGVNTITLVEPGDKESFLSAMRYGAKLSRETIQLELEHSAQLAKERFNLSQIAKQFMEFYRTVCE